MKTILIFLLGVGLIVLLFAGKSSLTQSNDAVQADSLFVVIYSTGEGWNASQSPNEQPFFKDHSAFMVKLRKDSLTLLGARYSDKGMLVIKSPNLQTAQQLIFSDKAVINKTFNAEVWAASFFYKGCVK